MHSASTKNEQAIVRHLALIWATFFIALLLTASFTLPHLKIETNILELLPHEEKNPLIIQAQQQQNQLLNQSMVWLIGATSEAEALNHANTLKKLLEKSNLFTDIKLEWNNSGIGNVYSALLPYRYQLLTEEDRQEIKTDARAFANNSLQLLYSPLGIQHATTLQDDPLFTFGDYINSLNDNPFTLYQDVAMLRDSNTFYAVILAQVKTGNVTANALVSLYQSAHQTFDNNGQALLVTGLPLYSAFGTQSAKREISTIGTLSIVAIIVFILLSFHSLRPLFLTLFSIGIGVLAAITVCNLIFDKLHIITLVFGSSLVGITVDYSFHYFSDSFQPQWSPWQGLKNVFQSITLGMASSVIAFLSLALTPFPGLKQMAIFSATGLFCAWLTVVLLFPLCSRHFKCSHKMPFALARNIYLKSWPAFYKKNRWVILLMATILGITGFTRLHPVDDIHSMQKVNDQLLRQETQIKSLFQQKNDNQFFIVTGKNADEVIHNEQTLKKELDTLIQSQKLAGYAAISNAYPSLEQQRKNYLLLKNELFDSGIVQQLLRSINMDEKHIIDIHAAFTSKANINLTLEQWLQAMPQQLQQQWLGCNQKTTTCASIVNLRGISNKKALEKLAANHPEYIWVDHVTTINNILHEYRLIAGAFIAAAIIVILILLGLSVSWRSAIVILSIPVSAIILDVALLALTGTLFNLFNVFALLLVLGIGLDYAIFHHLSEKHEQATSMAVILSMLTTLLAFGLLALSETTVIQAFGLTLSIGIILAFLLSPLISFKHVEV